MQLHIMTEKYSLQIVTKDVNNYNNGNNENNTKNSITLGDTIMQGNHSTPIIDSLKKEENSIDKIMETVVEENKKEDKMKTILISKR